MPRVCTVCAHPQRPEIDRALLGDSSSYRDIAKQFSISPSAVDRHKKAHIPMALAQAKAVQTEADAIDVMAELHRCFVRVNLLFDACDRWLRDADDPTRYDIGPRAEELSVTYEDVVEDLNGNPYTVRRKKKLSDLLLVIESETRTITLVETKYADPRDLVLKTANRLQGQLELLSRLMGDLQSGDTFNVVVSGDWIQVRNEILIALHPYPDAAQAVAGRLQMLEGTT
jgi:hypothetical protein